MMVLFYFMNPISFRSNNQFTFFFQPGNIKLPYGSTKSYVRCIYLIIFSVYRTTGHPGSRRVLDAYIKGTRCVVKVFYI